MLLFVRVAFVMMSLDNKGTLTKNPNPSSVPVAKANTVIHVNSEMVQTPSLPCRRGADTGVLSLPGVSLRMLLPGRNPP